MNGTAARDDRRSGGTEHPSGMRIFLIAGEESGDRLGASLMAAIEGLAPCPVTFAGVGGSAMAERGRPAPGHTSACSLHIGASPDATSRRTACRP